MVPKRSYFSFLKKRFQKVLIYVHTCVCVTCVAPTEARRGPGITNYSETLNVGAGNSVEVLQKNC